MKNMNALVVENVSFKYNSDMILDGISFNVEVGSVFGIIGPNGAGKSTLFNVICGYLKPSAGRIYLGRKEITKLPPHIISRLGIGRTFQICRPFKEQTVLENVLQGYITSRNKLPKIDQMLREARDILALVGLEGKTNAPSSNLTLSEQRRLELARALATLPNVLLLDEIGAGLSPSSLSTVAKLIEKLRQKGLTILVIDHFLNLTAEVSDRVILLDNGKKITEGEPKRVLSMSSFKKVYFGR